MSLQKVMTAMIIFQFFSRLDSAYAHTMEKFVVNVMADCLCLTCGSSVS